MTSLARNTVATVIPSLRYRNALTMIDWLCQAFGFEKNAVFAKGDIVEHAQLTFGHGMIMLGSVDNQTPWSKRLALPSQIEERVTHGIYLVVDDCATHYARAKEAGAEIVDSLQTKEYGGSGYSARDPEGYLWSFGDYDPWAEAPTP